MGKLSAEERPVVGKVANEVRENIELSINSKKEEINAIEKERKLKEEVIDVTQPGKVLKVGKKHPITQIIDEVTDIFIGMGFSIAEGQKLRLLKTTLTH